MKKKNKKVNIFKKILKAMYTAIDVILITPLSKLAYFISDKLSNKGGRLDKFLNNPNTLVYLSLILAFTIYIVIDRKIINLAETYSSVLTNQTVVAEYNEEAYVVEGIPDTADIILMGRKTDIYLTEQLGGHELILDLANLGEGTHKVKLKYNKKINSIDYKLDPSTVTVVVHSKVSESRTLTTDVLNTDKLNSTLVISSVTLDKDEVIIKSYKEKLETVASVKAIVDVNALGTSSAGTYTLDNVKLVAYDEKGTEIPDIEIVPGKITATVVITSPSKVVPIKVVPIGEVASGSAISSITPSVNQVTVYGEESVLKTLEEIRVEIDVNGLNADKTYQENIIKPTGIRSVSEPNITIKVKMEVETSKEFKDIPLQFVNLDVTKYKALASKEEDTKVNVVVKGVSALLNKLTNEDIKAYVDLSDLGEGTFDVPIEVTGNDLKLSYSSRTTKISVVISKK